jgi:hypothetical protein
MTSLELQAVANAVLRRAEQQGYVVPREIRAELREANQPEGRWKEVIELLRPSLNYRQGRYYFLSAARTSGEHARDQRQRIRDVVASLLQVYRSDDSGQERRAEERTPFAQPIKIQTEDDQEFTAMGRDLSPLGIRILAGRSLLGRKLRVYLPRPGTQASPLVAVVRILWTTAVGDGLFENGGTFLEIQD